MDPAPIQINPELLAQKRALKIGALTEEILLLECALAAEQKRGAELEAAVAAALAQNQEQAT